ncbi:MAG: MFS transporter [Chloroflexota bacterium]|nr:MFS transporter [Chloroflexota bacterium]MDE2969193.1 MFS transporter [Chloroflexota bacterium]
MQAATTEQESRRPRFFYGWVIVAIAIVGGAFTSGTSVWGASVFVTHMGDELGWTRSAFYGAFTVRALAAGALAPVLGPLQDRRNGPRYLMLMSAVSLGVALCLLKFVDDLWVFYLVFGGLGALSMSALGEMMTVAVVPKWFVRRRGRAVGIATTGTAMGPLFFPITVQALIEAVGWRDGWLVLGVLTLAVLVPLALLVRTRPEDVGLLPDGDDASTPPSAATSAQPSSVASAEVSYSRGEATRTVTFWLLALAFALATLCMGGFFANWLPYFQDIGFTAAVGSLAAVSYGICSISVRLFWGLLSERFSVRYLLAAQALVTAVSVIFFMQIAGPISLVLAGAFHGLAVGGFFIMRPMIVANYFGRQHLGAVNSIIRPLTTTAGSLSPLLIAGLYDIHGTYLWAFTMIVVSWLTVAAIVTFARPPARQRAAAGA